MSTKDVTDRMVLEAYALKAKQFKESGDYQYPYETLMARTGECFKVCYRAMERASDRGLIEYGVSLRTGWLTEKGKALLSALEKAK